MDCAEWYFCDPIRCINASYFLWSVDMFIPENSIDVGESGSKPLSIFGMAHKFQAEAMKKDCLAKYPQILNENCSPENRGLLSLLRDHLINLDFLQDEAADSSSSENRAQAGDAERAPRYRIDSYSAIGQHEINDADRYNGDSLDK